MPSARRSPLDAFRIVVRRVGTTLLFAGCLALLGCAGIGARRNPPITLVWYGLARQGTFQKPTYVALEDGLTLAAGDGVQLFLSVKPSAYVYVLRQTTSGEFTVWWPIESRKFNARLSAGRVQTLPSRGRVYTMGLTRGTEVIYLVASRKPIDDVKELTRELRWLFVTAQALAADVPPKRIRKFVPRDLTWKLDYKRRTPIGVVEQRVPVATTVKNIGRLRKGAEQWVTTAEGGTYGVQAEQIAGRGVIARAIRIRRTISRAN